MVIDNLSERIISNWLPFACARTPYAKNISFWYTKNIVLYSNYKHILPISTLNKFKVRNGLKVQ